MLCRTHEVVDIGLEARVQGGGGGHFGQEPSAMGQGKAQCLGLTWW